MEYWESMELINLPQSDQGFLGVINVKVTDVIDLELGGQGE